MRTRIEESIERVRTWVDQTGLKQATVAARAGLSKGSLRSMFEDDWNPRATTLWAVENLIPANSEELNHECETDHQASR